LVLKRTSSNAQLTAWMICPMIWLSTCSGFTTRPRSWTP
jgi:hypothetical protein